MGVSKVEYGGNTLIDLTEDSVTPETLAEGETAHNKAGEEITGTLKVQDEIVTTTGTGSFYKANVKGITELKSGVSFVMIPHTVSTSSTPMLAVNNLTAKIIKRMGVNSTLDDMSISDIPSSDWIKPSRAYRVMYNNGFWYFVDFPRPSAKDLIDNVPVEKGGVPSTNADNAGKVLTTNASGIPEWQEPTGGGSGGGSGGTTIKYSEGLEYSDEDAGFVVEGIGDCTDIDVMIPPEHSGRPVFCINAEAFESDGIMKSLYIPKTVTEIPGSIFASNGYAVVNIYCEAKSKPDGWSEDWNFYTNNNNLVEWGYVLCGGAGGSNSGGSLQMPQIRFANFQDTLGDLCLSADNPFCFTVEVVNGELKEGDLLQICVRRKYWYRTPTGDFKHKWKLRSVVQREITDEDFGKRFLSINVTLGNVESRGNWLFRNDRKPLRADGTIDTHSYMYFRIKRVTQYGSDGEGCNAIFSNVEKVAKTYAPHIRHLTIK